MNSARFTQWCIGLSAACLLGLHLMFGANPVFTGTSMLLMLAIFGVLLVTLLMASEQIAAAMVLLVFLLLTALIPGCFMLIAYPGHLAMPLPVAGVNQINEGLEFFLIGLSLMSAGIILVDRVMGLIPNRSKGGQCFSLSTQIGTINPKAALIVLGSTCFLSLLPFFLGGSAYVNPKITSIQGNIVYQLMILLFDPDSITLICLAVLFQAELTNRRRLFLIAFASLIYLLAMILGGSRVGLFRMVFMVLIVVTVFDLRYDINVRKVSLMIVGLLVAAFLIFNLGSAIRFHFTSTNESKLTIKEVFPEGVHFGILNRLSSPFHSAIQTTVIPPDETARKKYFTVEYAVKNFINNVPGTPYPEAELSTSRVYGVLYRGVSEEYIAGHGIFTEFYTVWGLSVLFLGKTMAPAAMILVGVLLSLALVLAWWVRLRQPVLYLWVIFSVPGAVIFTQGLDHSAWALVVMAVRFAFSAAVLCIFNQWWTRRQRLRSAKSDPEEAFNMAEADHSRSGVQG